MGQEAHLPFPLGEDMESLFQDRLLYKHSWKNKVKKGSQRLCSQDEQKYELFPQNWLDQPSHSKEVVTEAH